MEIKIKLKEFENQQRENELSEESIKQYLRTINQMILFCDSSVVVDITKDKLIQYKKQLISENKPNTVNNKIVIINKFLKYVGLEENCLKLMKIQQTSCLQVMTKSDYERMLRIAKKLKKEKIYYLIKLLGGSGCRISEVKYCTVESLKKRGARITNKGKIRDIIYPRQLCKELLEYCKKNNIKTGIVFKGRNPQKMISQSYIWKQLQYIAGMARVNKKKAGHCHGCRHMFAVEFMKESDNIFMLSDILGHSSLETTRIYTKVDVKSQRKVLENIYK